MVTVLSCDACGTPHIGISRANAENELRELYINSVTLDGLLIDLPDIANYEHCSFCGNEHTGFSVSDEPGSATMPYIINEGSTVRAEELHPHGTFAELLLDDASIAKLTALMDRLEIKNKIDPAKMHTTVIYSRRPCSAAMELDGMTAGYPAYVKSLKTWPTQSGTNCLVAEVEAYTISELHDHMRTEYGATHDYPDFTPHITLSYDCGDQQIDMPADLTDSDRTVNYTHLRVKPLDPKWE